MFNMNNVQNVLVVKFPSAIALDVFGHDSLLPFYLETEE